MRRVPFEPITNAQTPARGEALVQDLKSAVGLPMHSRRLGRQAVVKPEWPMLPAALLKKVTQAPATVAHCQRGVLILALVPRAVASAAPEPRTAEEDAAAPPAGWTRETLPMATERPWRAHKLDALVNVLGLAASSPGPVGQPDSVYLDPVADRAGFLPIS
jgi:hypothetical protein